MIVVPLDDAAPEATNALVAALQPKAVVLGARDDDEDGFDVHLLADPWVQLLFVTVDALERVEDEPDDEPEVEFTDSDRGLMAAVVDHLVSTTPLSSHGGQRESLEMLMSHVKDNHPELYEKLPRLWFVPRNYAQTLHIDLKDRHAGLLRSETKALAREVIDAGELTAAMPKPVLRDRVYAYFKCQDPTCATRSALEGVFYDVTAELAATR